MESEIPTRRSGLNVREIEQEVVIVDIDSGDVHQLNPTASFIWGLCDGNSSIESISSQFSGHYGISEEQATEDVVTVMQEFRQLNLLEK